MNQYIVSRLNSTDSHVIYQHASTRGGHSQIFSPCDSSFHNDNHFRVFGTMALQAAAEVWDLPCEEERLPTAVDQWKTRGEEWLMG